MSYIANGGAGGGGSGTVNAGTANQIAIYPASAAAVSGDALHTDDGTTLTYTGTGGILSTTAGGLKAGANGGAAGVLSLNGSTSGTATVTTSATGNDIEIGPTTLKLPSAGIITTTAGALSISAITNVSLTPGAQLLLTPGGLSPARVTGGNFHPGGGNLLFVTSNFTTAANTSLQAITGLSFTNSNVALNWNFHAALVYSQATGAAAVAFGIQAVTNSPTNIFATGTQQITAGPPATFVTGTLATLTTTTATNIVSGTPGAQGVNYTVYLDGTLELASSANTINFMVSTATSGDAVTVLRGSYVNIW